MPIILLLSELHKEAYWGSLNSFKGHLLQFSCDIVILHLMILNAGECIQ